VVVYVEDTVECLRVWRFVPFAGLFTASNLAFLDRLSRDPTLLLRASSSFFAPFHFRFDFASSFDFRPRAGARGVMSRSKWAVRPLRERSDGDDE
jgi:hypothetical protein